MHYSLTKKPTSRRVAAKFGGVSRAIGKSDTIGPRLRYGKVTYPTNSIACYNDYWRNRMTESLQHAFSEAAKLPAAEQELLAARLLAEVAAEDDFDRHIARTSDKLAKLAEQALSEHRSGLTEELDPDHL
jgi:hypothetical protein